jgi:hypothetical protein
MNRPFTFPAQALEHACLRAVVPADHSRILFVMRFRRLRKRPDSTRNHAPITGTTGCSYKAQVLLLFAIVCNDLQQFAKVVDSP